MRIQAAASTRRVRRAASILSRVPRDCKELIVKMAVESHACMALSVDVGMEQLVAMSFLRCGVGDDTLKEMPAIARGAACPARGQTQQEDFFLQLCHSFELATMHHKAISMDNVREYLNAALDFEVQYAMESSVAWSLCRRAIASFARCVLEAHMRSSSPVEGGRATTLSASAEGWMTMPFNVASQRVLEAAIVCVGA